MNTIERIRSALAAGPTDGPWIGAGPSHGAKLPLYIDSVVQDIEDDDCAQTICRDIEPEDAEYISACNPAAMAEVMELVDSQAAEIAVLHEKLDAMLAHTSDNKCEGPECSVCAEIICPEKSCMHFHHDGCPACYQDSPPDQPETREASEGAKTALVSVETLLRVENMVKDAFKQAREKVYGPEEEEEGGRYPPPRLPHPLEAENRSLRSSLAAVTAERDALKKELEGR